MRANYLKDDGARLGEEALEDRPQGEPPLLDCPLPAGWGESRHKPRLALLLATNAELEADRHPRGSRVGRRVGGSLAVLELLKQGLSAVPQEQLDQTARLP